MFVWHELEWIAEAEREMCSIRTWNAELLLLLACTWARTELTTSIRITTISTSLNRICSLNYCQKGLLSFYSLGKLEKSCTWWLWRSFVWLTLTKRRFSMSVGWRSALFVIQNISKIFHQKFRSLEEIKLKTDKYAYSWFTTEQQHCGQLFSFK